MLKTVCKRICDISLGKCALWMKLLLSSRIYFIFFFLFKGTESLSADLRLLCAADLYLDSALFGSCKTFESDDSFGMSLSAASENIFLRTKSRTSALENEALITCKVTPRPEWSSLIHIAVLANVLKRPIQSLYPDNTGFHYRQLYHGMFEPLSGDMLMTRPLHILWSVDGALPHGVFTPNHFVSVLANEGDVDSSSFKTQYKPKKKVSGQQKTLFDFNFSTSTNAYDDNEEAATGRKHESESMKTNSDDTNKPSPEREEQLKDDKKPGSPVETDFGEDDIAYGHSDGMESELEKNEFTESEPTSNIPEQNQPKSFQFPPRYFGKSKPIKRYFQGEWFDQFNWLHYSEGCDKAFCYTCMRAQARSLITESKAEQAFVTVGFTNWKDAIRSFTKHEYSESHKEAVLRLNISKECLDVGKTLTSKSENEMACNRKALLKLMSNLRFLARQGLPLRGAGDDSNSNFSQINLLRGEDDPEFITWLNKKRFKYDCPEIQNEILNIMGQTIVRDLASKMRQSEYFAILADETTDKSNREQLVVCLRWIDQKLNINEDFVGLYLIDNTKADTIAHAIKDVLIRLNISVSKCRGQTYDGASSMAGRKAGVQAQIKQEEKRALFNHCHGHLINLACADNVKSSKTIANALDTALEITKLVKDSPQRDTKLEKIRQAAANDGETPTAGIRVLCPTRWTVKANTMDRILNNYESLQELWDWSIENIKDASMKARIRVVKSHMMQFDFYFGLSLGECLLRHADNLSGTLQRKELSAAEGKSIAMKTVKTLDKMRSEESFCLFWSNVNKQAQKSSVENPKLPRKRKVPERFEMGAAEAEFVSSAEAHFRQIYYAAIDHITTAIVDRYDSQDFNTYLQAEQLLLKCVKGSTYEMEFETVTKFYGDDFHPKTLKSQLQALSANFESDKKLEDITLSAIVKYFESESVRNWLSDVLKLLKLVLIMPATNATSERSFSSLRRIKTFLRSTMTQSRLNSLMTLHVHRDYVDKLVLREIATEFIQKGQRITIFGKFDSSE